jgi:hypothetical protein
LDLATGNLSLANSQVTVNHSTGALAGQAISGTSETFTGSLTSGGLNVTAGTVSFPASSVSTAAISGLAGFVASNAPASSNSSNSSNIGVLATSNIPNLPASIITSGAFSVGTHATSVSASNATSSQFALLSGSTSNSAQFALAGAPANYSTSAVTGDAILRCMGGNLIVQSGNGASALYINNSNAVGINNLAPLAQLHNSGDMLIGASSSAWPTATTKGLYMRFSTNSTQNEAYIQSCDKSASNSPLYPLGICGSNIAMGGSAPLTSPTLYVAASGYVGLSTASPTCALDFGQGGANKQLGLATQTGAWYGIGAANSAMQYQTGGAHTFYVGSTAASLGTSAMSISSAGALSTGAITTNNSNINAGTGQVTANSIATGSGSNLAIKASQTSLYSGNDPNLGVKLWTNNSDGINYGGSNEGGLASWWGLSLRCTWDNTERHMFDTRTGNATFRGSLTLGTSNFGGSTLNVTGTAAISGAVSCGSLTAAGTTCSTLTMPGVYYNSYTIAADTTANKAYEFATFTSGTATAFDITTVSSIAFGTEMTKKYSVLVGQTLSATGDWLRCMPVAAYNTQTDDYELQVSSPGTTTLSAGTAYVLYFRLVHSNAAVASTITVNVVANYAQDSGVFSASTVSNSYTDAAWSTYAILSSTALTQVGGQVGFGTMNPSYKVDVAGTLRASGAATFGSSLTISGGLSTGSGQTVSMPGIVAVNDMTDSGVSRGIRYWSQSDGNWANYMSQSGANKSATNGSACASLDGRTAHQLRTRVYNGSTNGLVWENNAESCLMSLTGDTGSLFIKGDIGSAGVPLGGTAYLKAVGCSSLAASGTITSTSSTATGSDTIVLGNTSTANNTTKYIGVKFQGKDTVGNVKDTAYVRCKPVDQDYVGADLAFSTRTADALNERMIIRGSGNVGIGTSAPSVRFHVSGGSAQFDSNVTVTSALSTSNLTATGTVILPGNSVGVAAISGLASLATSASAADLTTGVLATARIPNLPASILNSGVFSIGAFGSTNISTSGSVTAAAGSFSGALATGGAITTSGSGTYDIGTSANKFNNLFTSYIYPTTFGTNLNPVTHNAYDVGVSGGNYWRNGYFGGTLTAGAFTGLPRKH